jgi:hypothetical protein
MGMRKFEEGDWAEVYAAAKQIPLSGWSNLSLDVVHRGLGVEHKMLCTKESWPVEYAGRRRMHPAATRAIRMPSPQRDADEAKDDVLRQYAKLIEDRRQKVAESSPAGEADLRTGWLLWKRDLSQFLYFEEELAPPDPAGFDAEWHEHRRRGLRKSSTNLWIFERDRSPGERVKRFSVTGGDAGAKIQPYFDIPPIDDPATFVFTTQGETMKDGAVRTWVTEETAAGLARLAGGELSRESLTRLIEENADRLALADPDEFEAEAREIVMSGDAARALSDALPALSDEMRLKRLVRLLLRSGD